MSPESERLVSRLAMEQEAEEDDFEDLEEGDPDPMDEDEDEDAIWDSPDDDDDLSDEPILDPGEGTE